MMLFSKMAAKGEAVIRCVDYEGQQRAGSASTGIYIGGLKWAQSRLLLRRSVDRASANWARWQQCGQSHHEPWVR